MHELSVCLALLEQVGRIAGEHDAGRVTRVVVRIGPLSGVEPGLLQRAWPLASAGSVAGGADLAVQTADVVVCCSRCGAETSVAPNRLLCGQCGDFRTRMVSGDELILQSLELEKVDVSGNPDADKGNRRLHGAL